MRWQVRISRRARKQMEDIPLRDREFIVNALDRLAENPYSGNIRKLTGLENEWRLRVGQWRVRFVINDDEHTIDVLRVLPRDKAYRD